VKSRSRSRTKGKVEKGKGREGHKLAAQNGTGASYHRGTGSVWEKIFEVQLHYITERGNDMYMSSREQDREAEDITRIGDQDTIKKSCGWTLGKAMRRSSEQLLRDSHILSLNWR